MEFYLSIVGLAAPGRKLAFNLAEERKREGGKIYANFHIFQRFEPEREEELTQRMRERHFMVPLCHANETFLL